MNFNLIPSSLRIPFAAVEFDSSRATEGAALLAYRALLLGQKHGAGTAAPNSLHRVFSADDVATLAGRGSMLHRQSIKWFELNSTTETWIGVLSDSSAGVIAEGSVTLSGTATKAGTVSFYLGGNLVEVAVAIGDTAATIAASLATKIGKHATGTITCASADAADNVTIGGVLDGAAVSVQFVGTAGAVTPGAATYSIDTDNTAAAASLSAQIKAHAVASRLVAPSSALGVVTLRAVAPGTDGNAVTLATTDAVDLAVSGATLAGGVAGENPDLPMHASVTAAVVSLRANNAGLVGNELDLRLNYREESQRLPAGITAALVQPAGGSGNPSLTALITALNDTWFHVMAHPYTDATSLTAIETEFAGRSGPLRAIPGVAITAKDDTLVNVAALGDTRNSEFSVILRTGEALAPPAEFAAAAAARVAFYGEIDPAQPFQTLDLPNILAAARADRDTATSRNQIVANGISTTRVTNTGTVQLETLVTTYRTNAAGSPDESYRSLNTILALIYARYNFVLRMAAYPRHKLGDDGVNYPAGEPVMTPSLGRAEAVSWYIDMSRSSPVVFEPSGLDEFKAALVVERDATNRNRLNFLLPPNLINQFIVSASKIQFRL